MDQVLSCTGFICISSMWIDCCSWEGLSVSEIPCDDGKKLYNQSGDHHQGMYCESPEEHQVLVSVKRNQIPKFWSSHLSHGSWRGIQWAQEMSVPSACPCFAMFTLEQLFLCRISSHSSHYVPVGVCSFRLLFPLSSSSLLLPWPWMVHFSFSVSCAGLLRDTCWLDCYLQSIWQKIVLGPALELLLHELLTNIPDEPAPGIFAWQGTVRKLLDPDASWGNGTQINDIKKHDHWPALCFSLGCVWMGHFVHRTHCSLCALVECDHVRLVLGAGGVYCIVMMHCAQYYYTSSVLLGSMPV